MTEEQYDELVIWSKGSRIDRIAVAEIDRLRLENSKLKRELDDARHLLANKQNVSGIEIGSGR